MKLLVGNFKMNLLNDEIIDYIDNFDFNGSNIVLCPSSLYLKDFINKGFNVGIQNIGFEDKGAYTGDISASMAKTTGKYKISMKINEKRKISYLHLIDRFSGDDIDLLIENDYEFIGSPRDNENRFIIKLNPESCSNKEDVFVFQNDNTLIVNGSGTLQIYDMLGRIVVDRTVNSGSISIENLDVGIYIARIIGDEIKTQKIIVK